MTAPTATALRCLAAGALLFAAAHYWPARGLATPPPAALERDRSDDGLLLREAFALGLPDQRTVAAVWSAWRNRSACAAGDDAGELEHQARAMGLEHSDPVVRRHLTELTRLAASSPPAADLPDEAMLRAYYAAHGAAFVVPERVRLTHVYFSRAQRGAAATDDAAAALAAIQRDGGVQAAGDGFARRRCGRSTDARRAGAPSSGRHLRTPPSLCPTGRGAVR